MVTVSSFVFSVHETKENQLYTTTVITLWKEATVVKTRGGDIV